MALFINSLARYADNFSIIRLKNRMVKTSTHFFSLEPFPDEGRIRAVARAAFEGLATLLILSTCILAMPLLWLGFTVYKLAQPSSRYLIIGKSGALTNEKILQHLTRIEKCQRKFKSIEIRYSTGFPSPELDEKCIDILKRLQIREITLVGTQETKSLAERLNTYTSYYTFSSFKAKSGICECHLELRKKIKHIVLDLDEDKILEQLKQIAESGQRVSKIFHQRMLPLRLVPTCENLFKIIQPDLHLEIRHYDVKSPGLIDALLTDT